MFSFAKSMKEYNSGVQSSSYSITDDDYVI
jgi:hypothetical protein